MRSSAFVLALAALGAAEQQAPLMDKVKGWFNQASAAVSSAVPAVPSAAMDAGRAKAAQQIQHPLTLSNWRDTLTVDPTVSTPTTQDWLVFITGGNTSCSGLCGNATKAWNTSLPLLAARLNSPKFAILDCDNEPILCHSWSVSPPSLYYFQIPKPLADQSAPAPAVRYAPLNRTSTTVDTLKTLVLDEGLEQTEPYEGVFHPFSGALQTYSLAIPVAYILWGFSKMLSWLPMILISFLSRSFI